MGDYNLGSAALELGVALGSPLSDVDRQMLADFVESH
jgi:hypothetical protein